jgi:hypothetical protein
MSIPGIFTSGKENVEALGFADRQSFDSTCRNENIVPYSAKCRRQELPDSWLVVHNQDATTALHHNQTVVSNRLFVSTLVCGTT